MGAISLPKTVEQGLIGWFCHTIPLCAPKPRPPIAPTHGTPPAFQNRRPRIIQSLGGVFCLAMGLASHSLGLTMALLVLFSICCQQSCGL